MPSKLKVRRALELSRAEETEITTILTQAFEGDPFYSFIYADAGLRAYYLRWIFRAALKDAIRFGRVDVAYRDKIVGVGVNYPPGRYPPSAVRNIRCFPEYLSVAAGNPIGFVRLYRALVGLNKLRPAQAHSYGSLLGGQQGEFAAPVLVQRWLHDADANHWPCYTETNNRKMVKFYSRLGFEVLQDGIEISPGVPPTWTMWRDVQGRP